jgi:hypothetical protein
MNRGPEHERLLADVLAENSPAEFREALLGETLQRVRRRRRVRQSLRAGSVIAVTALLAVFLWRFLPSRSGLLANKSGNTNYELVQTRPLSSGMVIATRPLTAGQLIQSRPTVAQISTTRNGMVRWINDDELLALVAPRPAALVRLAPDQELLVFANPEDERGIPLN